MSATLPLGETELVLTCADCGDASSGDVFGTEGWSLRRVSAQRLVDICPRCALPRPKRVQKTGATTAPERIQCSATKRVMLIREVAPRRAVGLAIDRAPHLSPCIECGAELRTPVDVTIERDGATLLAEACPHCGAEQRLSVVKGSLLR